MKLYNTDKLIFWIKRLFMCKKQITPNDCYKYFTELESSIQYLYTSIDNFLFQDIDRSIIQALMPQWVCDGGRRRPLGCRSWSAGLQFVGIGRDRFMESEAGFAEMGRVQIQQLCP